MRHQQMHWSVITALQVLELLARNDSATADRLCTTQTVPLTFRRLCCTRSVYRRYALQQFGMAVKMVNNDAV